MSWVEDAAARRAQFYAKVSEVWAALKAALARDLEDYQRNFGCYHLETKDRGDERFIIMFQDGTDQFTSRRDIHVAIDCEKRELTAAVTQTRTSQTFRIMADGRGNPVFDRRGRRYTVEQVSREVLEPHLKKAQE